MTDVTLTLGRRLCRLALAMGGLLLFATVLLPALTRSCEPLQRMAQVIEDSGIDPSRYYYTDVEAVGDAVHTIENSLRFPAESSTTSAVP